MPLVITWQMDVMRCELCMRAEVSIKANITKYYKHYEELAAPQGFNRVKMMKIYYDDDDKVACMSYFQTIPILTDRIDGKESIIYVQLHSQIIKLDYKLCYKSITLLILCTFYFLTTWGR